MRVLGHKNSCRGQSALEYLLIFAVVASIVLLGFNKLLPAVRNTTQNGYFTTVTEVILGDKEVKEIDGGWCPVDCSTVKDGGSNILYSTCECPAPAFGGEYCKDKTFPSGLHVHKDGHVDCDAKMTCPAKENCKNKQCGDDGCGGSCGTCSSVQYCAAGLCACKYLTCDLNKKLIPNAACTDCICVKGNIWDGTKCTPGVCAKNCGTKNCGPSNCPDESCGTCNANNNEICQFPAQKCVKCSTPRVPNSTGTQCICPPGTQDVGGVCVCKPQCNNGLMNCGDDGCGGKCGPDCTLPETCNGGYCGCIPNCAGQDCGPSNCPGVDCGTCNPPFECLNANYKCACIPRCEPGQQCGPSTCPGVDCGTCDAGDGEICTADKRCCQVSCWGKVCGGDGCGGTCGPGCSSTTACSAAGQCITCDASKGLVKNAQGYCTCPGNGLWDPLQDKCQFCPDGKHWDGSQCIDCPTGSWTGLDLHPTSDNLSCKCFSSQYYWNAGEVPPKCSFCQPGEPKCCPVPEHWDPLQSKCAICADGLKWNVGTSQCEPINCVPNCTGKTCGPSPNCPGVDCGPICSGKQVCSASQNCTNCPANKVPDANHQNCVSCPSNQIPDASGQNCIGCPVDQAPDASQTQCVCDSSLHYNGTQCQTCAGAAPSCACATSAQYHWNGSQCLACTGFQRWNGATCINCPGNQISVDGTSCRCPSPGFSTWNGTQCGCTNGLTYVSGACICNNLLLRCWNGTACRSGAGLCSNGPPI